MVNLFQKTFRFVSARYEAVSEIATKLLKIAFRFKQIPFGFFLIFCFSASLLHAQDSLRISTPNIQLKPLIVPKSEVFSLNGRILLPVDYEIDYRFGKVKLRQIPDSSSLFVAQYRVFHFQLQDQYVRYRLRTAAEDTLLLSGIMPPVSLSDNPFADSNLQRSGTISRGITAGNRQDVSVQSGFKMALSGEITQGIKLNAILTDENTPIQPEGNTQRLDDFDTVLIALEAKKWGVTLGDFTYATAHSEFAQFARKLQGVQVRVQQRLTPVSAKDSTADVQFQLAGATSRGLFSSQTLVAQEGVQGPYRLQGQNGEPFIIVLAGTEKVYLDGRLLERGDDLDYIMDYDAGEIRFMIKNLITTEKRIQVEFEYTTQRFTRSFLGAELQSQWGKKRNGKSPIKVGFSFLQEQDGSGFSDELGLNDAELSIIRNSGDNPATVSGAVAVPYSIDAPYTQYFKADTLYQGTVFQIFKPITLQSHTQLPLFRVRFTRLGEGLGDYKRVGNLQNINGLTFQWVGEGKGDYTALRILPQPQKQRLLALNAQWELLPGLTVFTEAAQSLLDKNRLSTLNDNNNQDNAFSGGFTLLRNLGKDLQLEGKFKHRFSGARFQGLGRVRGIEFGREWNLNTQSVSGSAILGANETRQEGFLALKRKNTQLSVNIGEIGFGDFFKGNRLGLDAVFIEPKLPSLRYKLESVMAKDSTLAYPINGKWLRQGGELGFGVLPYQLGISFLQERRNQQHILADSLLLGSFSFAEIKPSISRIAEKAEIRLAYTLRKEDKLFQQELVPESVAQTLGFGFNIKPTKAFLTDGEFGFRRKTFSNEFIQNGKSEIPSVVIQHQLRYKPFNSAIDFGTKYEALTEKATVFQEIFREVQVGQGDFIYQDVNSDGIRQIDEYLPTIDRFRANYIRLLLPSDSLRSVVNVSAKFRLGLTPSQWFERSENGLPAFGFKKFLSHFSTQTNLEIREKSEAQNQRKVYLLHPSVLRNPAQTINGQFRFMQELYILRGNPKIGLQFSYLLQNSLNRLASGKEARDLERWQGEIRTQFHPKIGFKISAQTEQNQSQSGFSSRSYNIRSYQLLPELTYMNGVAFQGSLKSIIEQKTDRSLSPNRAIFGLRFPLETRFMIGKKLQGNLNLEFANLRLTGLADGLAAFELTDGRGAGKSYLWNTMIQYSISSILRASLFYDGRAPQDSPILHTVRAQLSASF